MVVDLSEITSQIRTSVELKYKASFGRSYITVGAVYKNIVFILHI
jgi:hypothetical protein